MANFLLHKNVKNIIRVTCAVLLLVAVFNLPIDYYYLLRVVVFLGAIVMVFDNIKNLPWLIIFILIAFLFNPILPVYLINKLYWIPIDIIAAFCFLLTMVPTKEEASKKEEIIKNKKNYNRDKIY